MDDAGTADGDAGAATEDADADESDGSGLDRRTAVLATVPFLVIGLADVVFLVDWGLDAALGLLILPPMLFVCAIAYLAFRTGFVWDGPDELESDADPDLEQF
ncbi:MAG: hypothetical protein ABEJ31_06990 [Haloarculaceae archaeon]